MRKVFIAVMSALSDLLSDVALRLHVITLRWGLEAEPISDLHEVTDPDELAAIGKELVEAALYDIPKRNGHSPFDDEEEVFP